MYQFYDVVVNDRFRIFKGDPFRPFTPLGWQMIPDQFAAAKPSAGPPQTDDGRR